MDELEEKSDILEESANDSKGWTRKTILGCAGLVIYFAMAIFEMFVIYDWMIWRFELNGFLSALSAMFLAFVPGLGSLLAYWGATEVWGWESLTAIITFFWYYAPVSFYVLMGFSIMAFAILMMIVGKVKRLFSKE